MAKDWQLPVVNRPESQEICFFPEKDYRPFLKRNLAKEIKPGEVIDAKGRVVLPSKVKSNTQIPVHNEKWHI